MKSATQYCIHPTMSGIDDLPTELLPVLCVTPAAAVMLSLTCTRARPLRHLFKCTEIAERKFIISSAYYTHMLDLSAFGGQLTSDGTVINGGVYGGVYENQYKFIAFHSPKFVCIKPRSLSPPFYTIAPVVPWFFGAELGELEWFYLSKVIKCPDTVIDPAPVPVFTAGVPINALAVCTTGTQYVTSGDADELERVLRRVSPSIAIYSLWRNC